MLSFSSRRCSMYFVALTLYTQLPYRAQSWYETIWFDSMDVNNNDWIATNTDVEIGFVSDGCFDNQCTLLKSTNYGEAGIYRNTDISDYSSIRLKFDASNKGLESGDECYVYYAYDSFSNKQMIESYIGGGSGIRVYFDNQVIDLPSSAQSTQIWIFFEISGYSTDYCYWDNVELQGIPVTSNPTPQPTTPPTLAMDSTLLTKHSSSGPTNNPTPSPTYESTTPTLSPSAQSSETPTSQPTIAPAMPSITPTLPTKYPTHLPSDEPTNTPTSDPTDVPSIIPTVSATPVPTQPSITPTSFPSQPPTLLPSIDPTFTPTEEPPTVDLPPSLTSVSQSTPRSTFLNATHFPANDSTRTPSIVPLIVPSIEPTAVSFETSSYIPAQAPPIISIITSTLLNSKITQNNTSLSLNNKSISNAAKMPKTTSVALDLSYNTMFIVMVGTIASCCLLAGSMMVVRQYCKPSDISAKKSSSISKSKDHVRLSDMDLDDLSVSNYQSEIYTVHLNGQRLSNTDSMDAHNIKHVSMVHSRPGATVIMSMDAELKEIRKFTEMSDEQFGVFSRSTDNTNSEEKQSSETSDSGFSDPFSSLDVRTPTQASVDSVDSVNTIEGDHMVLVNEGDTMNTIEEDHMVLVDEGDNMNNRIQLPVYRPRILN